MASQDYVNLVSKSGGWPGAVGAAKNTFTSYQDVSPLPLPLLPAHSVRTGTKFEFEATGEFSTTGTPTFQIGLIWNATAGAAGGTALAQSQLVATASGAAQWPWHYRASGLITAVGASGSITVAGILDLGSTLIVLGSTACPVTAAARTVTIDTTVDALIGLGAAFGTSSASNQIKVNDFHVLLLN